MVRIHSIPTPSTVEAVGRDSLELALYTKKTLCLPLTDISFLESDIAELLIQI
jgi:hypothetical protein